MAEKRKRISIAKVNEFLALISTLNIEIAIESDFQAFSRPLVLARAEKLTSYDAAYLDLAIQKKLPLATKDIMLQQAAIRHHVFFSV